MSSFIRVFSYQDIANALGRIWWFRASTRRRTACAARPATSSTTTSTFWAVATDAPPPRRRRPHRRCRRRLRCRPLATDLCRRATCSALAVWCRRCTSPATAMSYRLWRGRPAACGRSGPTRAIIGARANDSTQRFHLPTAQWVLHIKLWWISELRYTKEETRVNWTLSPSTNRWKWSWSAHWKMMTTF